MSAPASRARRPMNPRRPRPATVLALVLAITLACQPEFAPTEPDFAKGGAATPLTVSPTTLSLSLPGTSAIITAQVQFVGLISASVAPGCATVTPASVPTTKPPGSSVYVATFTVTPVQIGTCTITVTDKKGRRATVTVQVTAATPGRIAFTSQRDDNIEIYVMDADGGNQTRLRRSCGGMATSTASGAGLPARRWSS